MATAKRNVKKVVKVVKTEVEVVDSVNLTLTGPEAKALVFLLMNVGGNEHSGRAFTSNILDALRDADVPHIGNVPCDSRFFCFYFADNTKSYFEGN
jgi:hypothetical protein